MHRPVKDHIDVTVNLTLSSRRASIRRPKQPWSCHKNSHTAGGGGSQIALVVKRVFNKISDSKNNDRMPAAGGGETRLKLSGLK